MAHRKNPKSTFQLAPHPSDPLSNVQPAAQEIEMETLGPNAIRQTVPAQQIWVYCGSGGYVNVTYSCMNAGGHSGLSLNPEEHSHSGVS